MIDTVDEPHRRAKDDAAAVDRAIDEQLVLDFVRGRNVHCPVCSYNLRDAVAATCSECGATLQLTLYGSGAGRPWGYAVAVIGLTLGLVTGAVGVFMCMVPPASPPVAIVSGSMALASFVMVCMVEVRFWRYWAKYAQQRTAMVACCWIPFAVGVLAILSRAVI